MESTSIEVGLKTLFRGSVFVCGIWCFGAYAYFSGSWYKCCAFTAGVGTLIFQFVCRKKSCSYIFSKVTAFIAPIAFAVDKWGAWSSSWWTSFCRCNLCVIWSIYQITQGKSFIDKYFLLLSWIWSCYYDDRTSFKPISCFYGDGKRDISNYQALNPIHFKWRSFYIWNLTFSNSFYV